MSDATVRDANNLEGQKQDVTKSNNPTEGKTYTQEEFDKTLQSEADKRVTEALKTAKEKWQEEFEANLKKEKSEAARLAKLSAEERAQEEFKKEKEKLDSDRMQFERERLELQVRKDLREQGVAESFAPFLMGEDAENSLKNINSFKASWDKVLEMAVKEQLKGAPPKAGTSGGVKNVWETVSEKYK
ncbi:MAG: DUF4355 domain-containing protein [Tissierellia bacterium]|nr:DUF4355 domain-containing protein [Tissierellia bacterium]